MLKLDQSVFGDSNPDEFAIQTNKKLVIPKKFDLPSPANNETMKNNDNIFTENSSKISEGEKQIIESSNNHKKNSNIKESLDQKPNILKSIF